MKTLTIIVIAMAVAGIASLAQASPNPTACTGTTIECAHTPIVGDAVHEHSKWKHRKRKH